MELVCLLSVLSDVTTNTNRTNTPVSNTISDGKCQLNQSKEGKLTDMLKIYPYFEIPATLLIVSFHLAAFHLHLSCKLVKI